MLTKCRCQFPPWSPARPIRKGSPEVSVRRQRRSDPTASSARLSTCDHDDQCRDRALVQRRPLARSRLIARRQHPTVVGRCEIDFTTWNLGCCSQHTAHAGLLPPKHYRDPSVRFTVRRRRTSGTITVFSWKPQGGLPRRWTLRVCPATFVRSPAGCIRTIATSFSDPAANRRRQN